MLFTNLTIKKYNRFWIMGLLIFLHFTLITAIICLVLIQRSAESSILVASTHFTPGGANKLIVKITKVLVAVFMINCLLISYIKYGQNLNKKAETETKASKSVTIPTE